MKAKLYAAIALIAVAGIVMIQNAEVVTVRFLFWEFGMSRFLLLLLTLLVGGVAGFIAGTAARRKRA